MANLSKQKREKILSYLKEFRDKTDPSDLETLKKINEIEKHIDGETYGLIFEKHTEDLYDRLQKDIPIFKIDNNRTIKATNTNDSNFLLEGDNLHSLYLLERTHKNKLDVIYIDPPYNTGAKDWKYNNDYSDKNDGFRHSKWLSMMNERLLIAKKLLKKDGVLICAIDENELATLTLLLQDIFGLDYAVDIICIEHNPRGVQGNNFSYTNEYALFVYREGIKAIEDTTIPEDEVDWSQFRNWGSESERSDAKNCFYPVYVSKELKIIGCGEVAPDDIHPAQTFYNEEMERYEVYPIDKEGVERKWRYATQSFYKIESMLRAKQAKDGHLEIEIGKTFGSYKTVWTGKKYDANTYGTQLINDMVPTNDFDFPKSLYNTYDCLAAVIKNKPDALVLDFFAGSGTTGHAVLLMNKLLGGNRHFILCTNNAIGEKREKEFAKLHPELVNEDKTLKTDSPEYKEFEEIYGIARSITYPRIKAAINGYTSKAGVKTIIYENKLTWKQLSDNSRHSKIMNDITKAIKDYQKDYDDFEYKIEEDSIRVYGVKNKNAFVDGLPANLIYMKDEFINIESNAFDLKDTLTPCCNELINLFEMKQIEEDQIIINDDDLLFVLDHLKDFETKTIYIGPDVLICDQDKKLLIDNNISYFDIPQLFYEKELRKAGEL